MFSAGRGVEMEGLGTGDVAGVLWLEIHLEAAFC